MKKMFALLALLLVVVIPVVSAQSTIVPCEQNIVGISPINPNIWRYFELKRQIFFGQQGFEFPCDQIVDNTFYELNGLTVCDDFGEFCTDNSDCDPFDNLPDDDFVCVNERCLETCVSDGDCSVVDETCEVFPDDNTYCVNLCDNGGFNPYDPTCCCTLVENFFDELNDPALLKQFTQEDRDIVLPETFDHLQDDLDCLFEVAAPLCANELDDDFDGNIDCDDNECNLEGTCVEEHSSEVSPVENGVIPPSLNSQQYLNTFKRCAVGAIKGFGILEQLYSKTNGAFFIVQKLEELELELVHKLAITDEKAAQNFKVSQFTCTKATTGCSAGTATALQGMLFNICNQAVILAKDIEAECEFGGGGGGIASQPQLVIADPCIAEAYSDIVEEYVKCNCDALDNNVGNAVENYLLNINTLTPPNCDDGGIIVASLTPEQLECKCVLTAIKQATQSAEAVSPGGDCAEPVTLEECLRKFGCLEDGAPPVVTTGTEFSITPVGIFDDPGQTEFTFNVLDGAETMFRGTAAVSLITAGTGALTVTAPDAMQSAVEETRSVGGTTLTVRRYTIPSGTASPTLFVVQVGKTDPADNPVMYAAVQGINEIKDNYGSDQELASATGGFTTPDTLCGGTFGATAETPTGVLGQGVDTDLTTVGAGGPPVDSDIVFKETGIVEGIFTVLSDSPGIISLDSQIMHCAVFGVTLTEFVSVGAITGNVNKGTAYKFRQNTASGSVVFAANVDAKNVNQEELQVTTIAADASGSETIASLTGAFAVGGMSSESTGIASVLIAAVIVIAIFLYVLRRRPQS